MKVRKHWINEVIIILKAVCTIKFIEKNTFYVRPVYMPISILKITVNLY